MFTITSPPCITQLLYTRNAEYIVTVRRGQMIMIHVTCRDLNEVQGLILRCMAAVLEIQGLCARNWWTCNDTANGISVREYEFEIGYRVLEGLFYVRGDLRSINGTLQAVENFIAQFVATADAMIGGVRDLCAKKGWTCVRNLGPSNVRIDCTRGFVAKVNYDWNRRLYSGRIRFQNDSFRTGLVAPVHLHGLEISIAQFVASTDEVVDGVSSWCGNLGWTMSFQKNHMVISVSSGEQVQLKYDWDNRIYRLAGVRNIFKTLDEVQTYLQTKLPSIPP
jgi:hypothetical protein